jgi:hypothetical protein
MTYTDTLDITWRRPTSYCGHTADQPTKHLAINDLTIYLHGADVDELEKYIAPAETFIATAYYGHRLDQDYGTDLSRLERLRVEKLLRRVDRAILIN